MIENFSQTPIIDHAAIRVNFNDHVTHRVNALIVGAAVVERCDAKETVAVLGVVKRMAEVAVARGEPAIEDLASHEVVFDIPLTEAPGERTIGSLSAGSP